MSCEKNNSCTFNNQEDFKWYTLLVQDVVFVWNVGKVIFEWNHLEKFRVLHKCNRVLFQS